MSSAAAGAIFMVACIAGGWAIIGAVWLVSKAREPQDGPWGPTGPDVHVIVDAFLKKHKSVIEGYAPQCPESPLARSQEKP